MVTVSVVLGWGGCGVAALDREQSPCSVPASGDGRGRGACSPSGPGPAPALASVPSEVVPGASGGRGSAVQRAQEID